MGQTSTKFFSSNEASSSPTDIRTKFNFSGIKDLARHPYISCLCSKSELMQESDPELFQKQTDVAHRGSRTILDKNIKTDEKNIESRHSFSYGGEQSPGIRKSFEVVSSVVHIKKNSVTPNNRTADMFFNPSRTSSNRASSRKSSVYVEDRKGTEEKLGDILETVEEMMTGRLALNEDSNSKQPKESQEEVDLSKDFKEIVDDYKIDIMSSDEIFMGGGRKYKGEMKNGKPHGIGKEIWPDGSSYEGMYNSGMRTGEGVFIWADKSFYTGKFVDNEMQGYGIFEWSNGNKYEGMWNKSKMHGDGTYTWNNGNRYIGSYFEGLKNGEGTFVYHDGRIVKGKWNKGHIQVNI